MAKCSVCGSKDAKSMKHLPLPDGGNGWITLTKWTDYCSDCAKAESAKFDKLIEAAKENVKNG